MTNHDELCDSIRAIVRNCMKEPWSTRTDTNRTFDDICNGGTEAIIKIHENKIKELRTRVAELEVVERKKSDDGQLCMFCSVPEMMSENIQLKKRVAELMAKRCQCGEKYRCPIHECQDALYRQIHHLEEELKAWRDDQASCMNERCVDEVHCTCVPSLRREVKKLNKKCENFITDGIVLKNWVEELQTRLSTLLKASEGMEKALEELIDQLEGRGTSVSGTPFGGEKELRIKQANNALADFRAVKEGK